MSNESLDTSDCVIDITDIPLRDGGTFFLSYCPIHREFQAGVAEARLNNEEIADARNRFWGEIRQSCPQNNIPEGYEILERDGKGRPTRWARKFK